MVEKLLDVLGDNLGGGYDIGCKFGITINKTTLGKSRRKRILNRSSALSTDMRIIDYASYAI